MFLPIVKFLFTDDKLLENSAFKKLFGIIQLTLFLLELAGMLYMLLGAYHKNICNLECVQQRVTKMFRSFKFCYGMTQRVRVVQGEVNIPNYSGGGDGMMNLKLTIIRCEHLRRAMNVTYWALRAKP